jgi:hypothetical protein
MQSHVIRGSFNSANANPLIRKMNVIRVLTMAVLLKIRNNLLMELSIDMVHFTDNLDRTIRF